MVYSLNLQGGREVPSGEGGRIAGVLASTISLISFMSSLLSPSCSGVSGVIG